MRNNIDSILLFSGIQEIPFPTSSNPKLFQEFLALKKQIKGEGESACLVYCKHHSEIIASSNTNKRHQTLLRAAWHRLPYYVRYILRGHSQTANDRLGSK